MENPLSDLASYVKSIELSGLSIYDPITVGDTVLWIPSLELQSILDTHLRGISLQGLPLRTRSKVVKEQICKALGYPIPKAFKKTKPRFQGQCFDTYVQKANNVQIWNEEISSTRRYAFIRVNKEDIIINVKVVNGDQLALLDTTGTLTRKYQARCIPSNDTTELVSKTDTTVISSFTTKDIGALNSPINPPIIGELLSISSIYDKLKYLVGIQFPDLGQDQERNRGAALHSLVCKALGYKFFQDNGQFPDVRHQLLEIKLQTSPTIDLGIALPSSDSPIDVPQIYGNIIRHCDVRYAVFYANTDGITVTITHLMLVTGEDFFTRFSQFQGKISNAKLQIHLPSSFFEG